MHSFNGEIKSVTIFSNTKLREILEFTVCFPNTPSKLKVQIFVLVTLYFTVYTITMGVACPLSL